MEKRLRNPVTATFNCPELSLLACIVSLMIGEYTNQIFSSELINNIKKEDHFKFPWKCRYKHLLYL